MFTWVATNPIPATCPGADIAASLTYSGSAASGGCDSGSGSWSNSLGDSGTFTVGRECDAPVGEQTYSSGIWGLGLPAYASANDFLGLVAADRSFVGRVVREQSPDPPQTDGCWFPGSPYVAEVSLSGGTWAIGSHGYNTYGYDEVGYLPNLANYYQQERPARGYPMPCGFTLRQDMQIKCNLRSPWRWYRQNILTGEIGPNFVAASRGGVYVSRQWPQ